MILVFWSGRGGLVFLAGILIFALTALINELLGLEDLRLQQGVLLASTILISFFILKYGKLWNQPGKVWIDKATGEEFTEKNKHTFFWIPMQYWAIIFPIAVLLLILTN